MKPAGPTVAFAVRAARGEKRRIRSFLRQVEELGVAVEELPVASVRALSEAERFLGRYLDVLAKETPTADQLEGVIEALGGIDRVVKRAMAEILKSLGWRPDRPDGPDEEAGPAQEAAQKQPPAPRPKRRPVRTVEATRTLDHQGGGGKVIRFPGPRSGRPRS